MALFLTFVPAQVWADCKSDCRAEYKSKVDSCESLYNNPEDSNTLRRCLDTGKDQYDSCINKCENRHESSQTIRD